MAREERDFTAATWVGEAAASAQDSPALQTGQRVAAPNANSVVQQALAYQVDFWQRGVLFLDTMRERAGMPALLDFAVGMVAYGWAMFRKHRLQARAAPPAAWERAAYWGCWGLFAALAAYIGLQAI